MNADRPQGLMALWRYRSPWLHEAFDRADEIVPPAGDRCVLCGMGAHDAQAELVRRAWRENRAQTRRLVASLPRHRDLIERIVRHRLQLIRTPGDNPCASPLSPRPR